MNRFASLTTNGLFITFEGIDFCGKTTQARRLASYLTRKGYDVLLIREPGGDRIAEKIRKILLSEKNSGMTSLTELLLYEASRAQLTEKVILPALKEGKAIVCDRYFDSTLAYQGYGRGLNKKMIEYLNQTSAFKLKPDLTILLDVSVATSFDRRNKEMRKKDRLERERIEFHRKIREGYLKIARQDKRRIKIVDGTDDIDKTWQKVKWVVDSFLSKSKKHFNKSEWIVLENWSVPPLVEAKSFYKRKATLGSPKGEHSKFRKNSFIPRPKGCGNKS